MKTEYERSVMTARVRSFFADHPVFEKLPVAPEGDIVRPIKEQPVTQSAYVEALYEVCAKGLPVGRSPDRKDVPALIGIATPFFDNGVPLFNDDASPRSAKDIQKDHQRASES